MPQTTLKTQKWERYRQTIVDHRNGDVKNSTYFVLYSHIRLDNDWLQVEYPQRLAFLLDLVHNLSHGQLRSRIAEIAGDAWNVAHSRRNIDQCRRRGSSTVEKRLRDDDAAFQVDPECVAVVIKRRSIDKDILGAIAGMAVKFASANFCRAL